jgi:hypothetical protein
MMFALQQGGLGRTKTPSGSGGGGGTYRYVRFRDVLYFGGDPDVASVAEFNVLDGAGSAYSRAGWTATATSEFGSGGAGTYAPDKAIDGNTGTIWHSQSGAGLPQHLQIDMGVSQFVGGFKYLPRQDSPNGRYNGWEFYGSNDGSSWTLLGSGNFASGSAEITVYPL